MKTRHILKSFVESEHFCIFLKLIIYFAEMKPEQFRSILRHQDRKKTQINQTVFECHSIIFILFYPKKNKGYSKTFQPH